MAWIQVDQALPTHRKTLILADTLEISPTHAVGLMVTLWLWSLDNAPDGLLEGIPPRTLARILQWDGDADRLMEAMRNAGFLDDNEIHDWQDYAGRLLDQRAAAKERMRKHRASTAKANPKVNDVTETLPEQNANVAQTDNEAGAHVHSRLQYSRVENSKEHKRTKEKKKKPAPTPPDKVKFAEFVTLTDDEYAALVTKLGEEGAKQCIEILDNYKGANGKKYKSDYRAILNWVINRYQEEQSKRSVNQNREYQPARGRTTSDIDYEKGFALAGWPQGGMENILEGGQTDGVDK